MNSMHVLDEMIGAADVLPQKLGLKLPGMMLCVRSNSTALLDVLRNYFRHIVLPDGVDEADCVRVVALERAPLVLDVAWQDWPREAGKSGRKDSFFDVEIASTDASDDAPQQARLIRKVRTGMVFLQSMSHRIAAGPCLANANQVINFINNQYMNQLQQQGWLICHAAAVARDGQATAIAGFSGGGKSTMMLHLMNHDVFDYLTNDRMFINVLDGSVQARGIPKLPRVNPGTIVYNERLKSILPADEIAAFEAMPRQQLWNLEQKYDVDVSSTYGADRFADQAPLQQFIVLNWSHDSQQPTNITEVAIAQRPELLDAIMKSSGPFYQHADGRFDDGQVVLEKQPYIAMLSQIRVIEVSGAVDFQALEQDCLIRGRAG